MAMNLVASPISSSNDTIFESDSPSMDNILVGPELATGANENAGSKRSHTHESMRATSQSSSVSDANASSASGSVQFTTPPMVSVSTFTPQLSQSSVLPSSRLAGHTNPRTISQQASFSQPLIPQTSMLESRAAYDDQGMTMDGTAFIHEKQDSNHTTEDFQRLEETLQSCWALLGNLAGMSQASWPSTQSLPRPTAYSRPSLSGSAWSAAVPESAGPLWQPCWELVQKLYDLRASSSNTIKATTLLDLVRPFAQYVGRLRCRADESADGILRTVLGLGDHLYSFTDMDLPDEFWERTLDFHVTLCWRFLKQRATQNTGVAASAYAEEDNILLTCWTVAETLLVLLKSQRHNAVDAPAQSSNELSRQFPTDMDIDQLSAAIQACFALEDTFRHTWRHRIDYDTPKPIQPASFEVNGRSSTLTHSRSRMRRALTASSDLAKFEPEDYQIEPPLDSAMAPSEYTATTATIDESDSLYSFGDFSPRSNSPFQSPLGIRNINDTQRMEFSGNKPSHSLAQSFRRALSFEDHKSQIEDSREAAEPRFLIGKLRRLSSSFALKMPETPSTIFEDMDHHPGLSFEDDARRGSVDDRGTYNFSVAVDLPRKDELATAIQRFPPTSTLRSRRSSTGSLSDQRLVATAASLLQSLQQDPDANLVKPQTHLSSNNTEEMQQNDDDDAKRVSRSSSALSQSTAMPASVRKHDIES